MQEKIGSGLRVMDAWICFVEREITIFLDKKISDKKRPLP
jgi:hypothetical protein